MSAGVYKIYCIANDTHYIGESTDVLRRWTSEHKPHLIRGRHANKHLQSAWNRYGPSYFSFEVIWMAPQEIEDTLSQESLSELTRRMEATIGCAMIEHGMRLFNFRPFNHWSRSSPMTSNIVREKVSSSLSSPTSKAKRSASQKEQWALPGQRERRSALMREAWANKPESRERLSLSLQKIRSSQQYKAAQRERSILAWSNQELRADHSKKLKLAWKDPRSIQRKSNASARCWEKPESRQSRSGGNHFRSKTVRCMETGETFPTISAAGKSVGVSSHAVGTAIRRGHKCGGFTWEIINK